MSFSKLIVIFGTGLEGEGLILRDPFAYTKACCRSVGLLRREPQSPADAQEVRATE